MSNEFLVNTLQQTVRLKNHWTDKIVLKTSNSRKTELSKIHSACKFTAHYTCRNVEMNLKSTTTNKSNFCKNKFINQWILQGGGGRLDCNCPTLSKICFLLIFPTKILWCWMERWPTCWPKGTLVSRLACYFILT